MMAIIGPNQTANNVHLFLNELHPNQNESVPDPYYGAEDGYHTVYKLIEETCNIIINKYK